MELNDITYAINGAIFEVNKVLGPGVGLRVDRILAQINDESVDEPGYKYKKISATAKNLMLQHTWRAVYVSFRTRFGGLPSGLPAQS